LWFIAIISDCPHGASLNTKLAKSNFFWSCGLSIHIGIASLIEAAEVVWCNLAAKGTVGALIIDIELAGNVLWKSVGKDSHNPS